MRPEDLWEVGFFFRTQDAVVKSEKFATRTFGAQNLRPQKWGAKFATRTFGAQKMRPGDLWEVRLAWVGFGSSPLTGAEEGGGLDP